MPRFAALPWLGLLASNSVWACSELASPSPEPLDANGPDATAPSQSSDAAMPLGDGGSTSTPASEDAGGGATPGDPADGGSGGGGPGSSGSGSDLPDAAAAEPPGANDAGLCSETSAPSCPDAGAALLDGGTASLVQPILRDGLYTLEFEDTLFQVDPLRGARIVTFAAGGQNVLLPLDESLGFLNGGSTFWTSPQVTWDWPPVPAIDSEPYLPTLSGSTIGLDSAVASFADHQLSIRKRISPDLERRAIRLEYTIINQGGAAISVAPWQVSRVAIAGLSFWPEGDTVFGAFTPTLSNGHRWVDYEAFFTGTPIKAFADATGSWLAHVAGRVLFVKAFADLPLAQQAPNEAEVEIYLDASYVEIEAQGAYLSLTPQASLEWTVIWYIRELAPNTDVSVGSQDLVDAVRAALE